MQEFQVPKRKTAVELVLAGGAWSGRPVITKGGLVGGDSTLRTLVDDLWRD